mmetsp:Transcript_19686/g.57949  ORF Transcript_19686/g.57949 Transcript_19686/m.57949 type:complete len:271 (-) Transcript_19686:638-1450(-)
MPCHRLRLSRIAASRSSTSSYRVTGRLSTSWYSASLTDSALTSCNCSSRPATRSMASASSVSPSVSRLSLDEASTSVARVRRAPIEASIDSAKWAVRSSCPAATSSTSAERAVSCEPSILTDATSSERAWTPKAAIRWYMSSMVLPRSASSDCIPVVFARNSEKATNSVTPSGWPDSTLVAWPVSSRRAAVRRAASSGSAAWSSSRHRCGEGRKISLRREALPAKIPTVACVSMASKARRCPSKRSSSSRHSSRARVSATTRVSTARFAR